MHSARTCAGQRTLKRPHSLCTESYAEKEMKGHKDKIQFSCEPDLFERDVEISPAQFHKIAHRAQNMN